MKSRYLIPLPVFGIFIFLALYFYAASIYPGGTRLNPTAVGFSQMNNYWCDLLDPLTYAGQPNPSRAFALIGTIVMPLSIMSFWFFVPTLFTRKLWRTRTVQVTGCLSMLSVALMPLAHDTLINIASLFGFPAFLITLTSLIENKEFKLFAVAFSSILICAANFYMWKAGFLLEYMPIVQKMAFLSFFIWIILSVNRYKSMVQS